MKSATFFRVLALTLTTIPALSIAQDPAAQQTGFSVEQIEQIVAPIALYPDALLAQMFMASTYPLEIVEAERWSADNPLTGAELDAALKSKNWDASVKSLCAFPEVLQFMSENLDWTTDLGDAFLDQQTVVMDAVQRLRGMAYDAGNLKTTPEQKVTVDDEKLIVIAPAEPEVVYVPDYSPTEVYDDWSYETAYYAPIYAQPYPAGGALVFAAGAITGAALWGQCDWAWGNCNVSRNVENYNNFSRNTSANFTQVNNSQWQHSAEHRKGVNYRDPATAQRFGGTGAGNRVSTGEARGFESGADRSGVGQSDRGPSGADRSGVGQSDRGPSGADRSGVGQSDRGPSGADRSGLGQSDRPAPTARTPSTRAPSVGQSGGGARSSGGARSGGGSSGGAFSGSSSPGTDRAASSRGASSRSASSGSRSGGGGGGGGSRGGGGGGGGGGRGGGGGGRR